MVSFQLLFIPSRMRNSHLLYNYTDCNAMLFCLFSTLYLTFNVLWCFPIIHCWLALWCNILSRIVQHWLFFSTDYSMYLYFLIIHCVYLALIIIVFRSYLCRGTTILSYTCMITVYTIITWFCRWWLNIPTIVS